ncbi:MAG: hypothetical protein LBQ20_09875 [Rhodanobacter sp.]|jgi:hypothetical protein|nr:hypothetical protein [Rhodanobacter sp.]
MDATTEQMLVSKIKALSTREVAEVEDFVDFLVGKARKRSALERLLAMAPALEAAGAGPISEEEIAAEIKAARAQRRADNAAGH